MGLAAASHFIVNVASKTALALPSSKHAWCSNANAHDSHRGRSQRICQYQGKLLLRIRGMHCLLFRRGILVVPVSCMQTKTPKLAIEPLTPLQ